MLLSLHLVLGETFSFNEFLIQSSEIISFMDTAPLH